MLLEEEILERENTQDECTAMVVVMSNISMAYSIAPELQRKALEALFERGSKVGVFSLSGEEFGDLYIHPAYQKQGYGTACIRFALSQTHDLRLTVLSTNLSAIALYEKIGFRFTGNTIPLKNGLWEREMKYMEH